MNSILKFLGCGAAFYPVLGNTSAYFIKNNNLYLLDCGELVFHQLYERGMLTRYDRIYSIITHLHADQVGSLGSLISYTYFVLGKKVRVIHPEESVRQLLDLTGIDRNAYYFEQCTRYESDGIVFEAVPVRHAEDMNCYGYIIEDGGRRIYYSGDSYEIPEHVINGFLERRIEKIYQDAGLSKVLVNYTKMMCRLGYIGEIEDILDAFYLYWDRQNHILRAELTCAGTPQPEEEAEARKILAEKYPDCEIVLTEKEDENLLGGYIIKVHHKEYDRSYEGRLRQLERKLTGR